MIMVEEQMNRMDKVLHDENDGRKRNKETQQEHQLPKRFPFRLNKMLNDAETHGNDHIVSWMPGGKMFKVHKHKEFANSVMPLYCRHSRYKSFLRQLSMYKFQRVNEGPLRGCYHHPNFVRDRFDLIDKINRKDRGDEDSSVSCSSMPLATHSATVSDFVASDRKSLQEEFLSESDSDTLATDNNHNFESINISVHDSYMLHSIDERKGRKRKNDEMNKEISPKTATEFSSSTSCSTAIRTVDPLFDSVRNIGYQTGLFDLRDDITTKSPSVPLTSASVIMEPLGVGSHHPNSMSTSGGEAILMSSMVELSQAFHPSDSSDILDEIIKTFRATPPDT